MKRHIRDFGTPIWSRFFRFLVDRQRVWYRKEILKETPPWTDDPILQQAKFTNIYRELDRVSRFEIQFIVKGDFSFEEKLKRIILLRHTNSLKIYSCLINGGTLDDLYLLRETCNPKSQFVSDAVS